MNELPKPLYKDIYGSICGSDFQNYATKLRFLEHKKRWPSLVILHRGNCKRICQLYAPVCASNWKTYHNDCQLEYAKRFDKSLYSRFRGKCPLSLLQGFGNVTPLVSEDYYLSTQEEEDTVIQKNCSLHC